MALLTLKDFSPEEQAFAYVAGMFRNLSWGIISRHNECMDNGTRKLRLPNLDIVSNGTRYWVEVRTKRAWRQTELDIFDDFRALENGSGTQVICVSVDFNDGIVGAFPVVDWPVSQPAVIARFDRQAGTLRVDRQAVDSMFPVWNWQRNLPEPQSRPQAGEEAPF